MTDSMETAQHFIFITQVYFCAMYAVIIWDWLISLPREWRFVWKSLWTPVKVAYLFCRYWVIATVPYLLYCFVVDHTAVRCQSLYKVPVALAMWNQVGSETVLLIRTYAFFNRNNYLLMFLVCCLSGVVAYQLYVDTSQMLVLPFVKPPFTMGPCFPMSKPHSAHLLGFFIAPLLFDTLVTSITVWKAFTIRRRSGATSSRLIQTFLREGVFYYILISIANLINGIFYLQPRQAISAINIPLSVMMSPLLACRLILDLRERGSETIAQSTLGPFNAWSPSSPSPRAIKSSPPGLGVSSRTGSSGGLGFRFVTGHPAATFKSDVVLGSIAGGGEVDADLDGVELENVNLNALVTGMGKEIEDSLNGEMPAPAYRAIDMGGIRVDVEKTTTTI
ncbi:hypothetical protein NEOLEDRAFT_1126534 [Neolentinus lepideus HHB14362 ss-1]|uniref:DUF6533 domain-containing protein n=1 Tax=Neolentinus lepideus HHB14362 ss-1 TaxID=1314782 RepID=A0A165W9R3_9AGAM|nr:hypothetical protein NEOLEDRAFT_1126534 [Neolentinus lepideus HHB14362 ss-1]